MPCVTFLAASAMSKHLWASCLQIRVGWLGCMQMAKSMTAWCGVSSSATARRLGKYVGSVTVKLSGQGQDCTICWHFVNATLKSPITQTGTLWQSAVLAIQSSKSVRWLARACGFIDRGPWYETMMQRTLVSEDRVATESCLSWSASAAQREARVGPMAFSFLCTKSDGTSCVHWAGSMAAMMTVPALRTTWHTQLRCFQTLRKLNFSEVGASCMAKTMRPELLDLSSGRTVMRTQVLSRRDSKSVAKTLRLVDLDSSTLSNRSSASSECRDSDWWPCCVPRLAVSSAIGMGMVVKCAQVCTNSTPISNTAG